MAADYLRLQYCNLHLLLVSVLAFLRMARYSKTSGFIPSNDQPPNLASHRLGCSGLHCSMASRNNASTCSCCSLFSFFLGNWLIEITAVWFDYRPILSQRFLWRMQGESSVPIVKWIPAQHSPPILLSHTLSLLI